MPEAKVNVFLNFFDVGGCFVLCYFLSSLSNIQCVDQKSLRRPRGKTLDLGSTFIHLD